MADAIASLMFLGIFIFLTAITMKYRKEILNWLSRAPSKRASSQDMKDFDTLTELGGIKEEDAIEKIRQYRVHREEVSKAIAENSAEKTETEGFTPRSIRYADTE